MSQVLITGADGHLGRKIANWFLDNTERELSLWVRARDDEALAAKRQRLQKFLDTGRCRVTGGDLTQPAPLDTIDPRTIVGIIHAAADTNFGISGADATAINVEGSRKVFEFASRCNRLEQLTLLSTVYSVGLREGQVREELLDCPSRFANEYERSKWEAERALSEEFSGLPWQILRVGTVLADNETGQVTQYNAVHNTLRLFYYGLLSVIPGAPRTRLYVTTSDFAAAACGLLSARVDPGAVFHVSDNGSRAIRMDTLIDLVYDSFNQDERFRKMRILRPLFCEWDAFSDMAESAGQFSGILAQSLGSVAPFARQLYADKDISTTRLEARLPDLTAPDATRLIPRLCAELVASRWGLTRARERVA